MIPNSNIFVYILESSSQSEGEASNSDSENDKAASPPPINMKPKKNNKKDPGRKQQIKNKKSAKSAELSANEIAKLLVQAADEGKFSRISPFNNAVIAIFNFRSPLGNEVFIEVYFYTC